VILGVRRGKIGGGIAESIAEAAGEGAGTSEVVGGMTCLSVLKNVGGQGSIFNNSSRKRKSFRDCLNLLGVCHLVRQALFSTRGSYEGGGFAHSKVKESTKAPLAESARLRPSAADGAGDAAVPIRHRIAPDRMLRELVAANAAIVGVAGVVHLVYRVNGEQARGITLLIRICKVKGAVNDQRGAIIPAKDIDKEPLCAQGQKRLLDFPPIGLRHFHRVITMRATYRFNFSLKYRSSISFEKAAEASRQHFGHGSFLNIPQLCATDLTSVRA
jgi:hypothetical protein